ncbi:transposase InsO family protein [Brachybacterium muris]|nr:transposase InsO family protein [Brachybacterium muris]
MSDECLYTRRYKSENQRREAIRVWNHHYNNHRPHTACGDQPPASRLHTGVDNVMTNYI